MLSRWNKLALFCTLAGFLAMFPANTRAESGSITVTPALVAIELTAPHEAKSTQLQITNGYDTPITLTVELKGIDQVSGTLVPTDGPDSILLQSSALSNDLIYIPAGGSSELTYSVENTDQLPPGGHYATLVLREQASTVPDVGFRSALSVAVFVVKRGGEQEHVSVTNFTTNASLFQFIRSAQTTFKNDGNVHTQPRGVISASRGITLVAKGVVNEESLSILPGKELTDTTALTQLEHSRWPIWYDVNLEYRTDFSNDIQRLTVRQLYVPPLFAAGILAALFGITTLLYQAFMKPKPKKPAKKQPLSSESKGVPIHVRRVRKVTVKTDDE